MPIRGIRGAIVASNHDNNSIVSSTKELLISMLEANPGLKAEDIASIIFTVTDDLCEAFPARAVRELGWKYVPLICAREIPVPGDLERCIRILVHWNTRLAQRSIHHVYMGDAAQLRPDLTN
jgi:chorismate mutase